MKQSDGDLFAIDSEDWRSETIEEAKARLSAIVTRNRALRERIASTPTPKKSKNGDSL